MEPEIKKRKKARESIQKIETKIEEKIDKNLLLFKIFDDPRPNYVAKVTIIDKFINATLLWLIPKWVRPNYVTSFRFISIPFIIYFLIIEDYSVALPFFVISAVSDAVDGALARTRNQITDWGIVFDPLADKLLIGIVGWILISKFINPFLAMIIIVLELILISSAYFRFKGEVVPAKTAGKIKMVLQCVGVGEILLFTVVNSPIILVFATYTLWLAIFFALISVFVYKSI